MNKSIKFVLFTVPLTFLLFYVLYTLYGVKYTKVMPSVNDLIGTYIPSPDSDMEKFGQRSNFHIQLGKGGQCAMKVPEFWMNGRVSQKVVFASGKWQLEEGDRGWEITVFQDIGEREEIRHIVLLGASPPYKLALEYGEPDEGQALVFDKK